MCCEDFMCAGNIFARCQNSMRIVKILYVLQDFICALRLYVHFKTIWAVQRHYARFKSFMRASKVLRALRRPYAHFESFTRIAKTLCALRKFYPQSEDIMRTAKTLCERKEDSIMKKIMGDSHFSTKEGNGSTVRVYADDVLVYTSPDITYKSGTVHASVDIIYADNIRITVTGRYNDENSYIALSNATVSK